MANKGPTRGTRQHDKTSKKAQGDDQGAAWEINDSAKKGNERDEEPPQSRVEEEYQGAAWKINENTEGS